MRPHIAPAAVLALALAGCQQEPPAKPLTPQQSAKLKPADAHLAALYDQSCRSCHTVADTGAPLTGDRTKWDPRWAKGVSAMLNSAVQGLNGMPTGGQCFSCTPDDYRKLIRFMAGREQ
ncbi:MAG: c-type cytochrome [Sphingomonadaceae bacterium]